MEYYEKMLIEDWNKFIDVNDEKDEFYLHKWNGITLEEVEEAVRKMKDGKAPGPEGVTIELLKYGPEKVFHLLAYIFNLFLRGEELPSEWKTACFSNLYKNEGFRKECDYYRGLSVTYCIRKLYKNVLKNRIENC